MIRVLIAPCGCLFAVDARADYPGFARTEEEAAEDRANGFTEHTVSNQVYKLMKSMGCEHDPQWGVKPASTQGAEQLGQV